MNYGIVTMEIRNLVLEMAGFINFSITLFSRIFSRGGR